MGNLTKRESNAVEAVARSFAGTWESAGSSAGAWLLVDRKRIAVDIATLDAHATGRGDAATPRLRFDKVVARVLERLRSALDETIPDGVTVLVTITAPIRLASKTAAAVEKRIQTLVRQASAGRGGPDTIHRNRVQVRVVRHQSDLAPKVIGFVHNPDADPAPLMKLSRVLLERGNGHAGRRKTRAGDRWLIAITGGGCSSLEAYRYVHSQLRAATGFQKVVIVFPDDHVEALADAGSRTLRVPLAARRGRRQHYGTGR